MTHRTQALPLLCAGAAAPDGTQACVSSALQTSGAASSGFSSGSRPDHHQQLSAHPVGSGGRGGQATEAGHATYTGDLRHSSYMQRAYSMAQHDDQFCRRSQPSTLLAPQASAARAPRVQPGRTAAPWSGYSTDASDDLPPMADLPQLPAAVRSSSHVPSGSQLPHYAAGTPPLIALPADSATGAALAGAVHSAQTTAAAAHATSPRQQAVGQAAAVQQPAALGASSRWPVSNPFLMHLGGASRPGTRQLRLVQSAAPVRTGWRRARDHAAVHLSVKDVSKRILVPKRVLGMPFGGRSSIPMAIDLYLLASDSCWPQRTVVRPRSMDGLDIPKSARTEMQREAQREALYRASSTENLLLQLEQRQRPSCSDILVMQRMECDGVLSPNALGIGLLTGDVPPEIRAEAEEHADANLMRQQECSRRPPKRRKLAPTAEPAARTYAAAPLALGGRPHATATAGPRSGESAADWTAAGPPQEKQAASPQPPPDHRSTPRAWQHPGQPAVVVPQATAGKACLHPLLISLDMPG